MRPPKAGTIVIVSLGLLVLLDVSTADVGASQSENEDGSILKDVQWPDDDGLSLNAPSGEGQTLDRNTTANPKRTKVADAKQSEQPARQGTRPENGDAAVSRANNVTIPSHEQPIGNYALGKSDARLTRNDEEYPIKGSGRVGLLVVKRDVSNDGRKAGTAGGTFNLAQLLRGVGVNEKSGTADGIATLAKLFQAAVVGKSVTAGGTATLAKPPRGIDVEKSGNADGILVAAKHPKGGVKDDGKGGKSVGSTTLAKLPKGANDDRAGKKDDSPVKPTRGDNVGGKGGKTDAGGPRGTKTAKEPVSEPRKRGETPAKSELKTTVSTVTTSEAAMFFSQDLALVPFTLPPKTTTAGTPVGR